MRYIEIPLENGIDVVNFIDKPINYGYVKIVYPNVMSYIDKPGVLHFFEHLAFKLVGNLEKSNMYMYLEASTGFNLSFNFNLFKGDEFLIRDFIDHVRNFSIKDEELEVERNVILNEIAGDFYDENAQRNIDVILDRDKNVSCRLGSSDDVRSITIKDILEVQDIISNIPPCVYIFGLDATEVVDGLKSLSFPQKELYTDQLPEVKIKNVFNDLRGEDKKEDEIDCIYINWLLPLYSSDIVMIGLVNQYMSSSASKRSLLALLLDKGLIYSMDAYINTDDGVLFNLYSFKCFHKDVDDVIMLIKKYIDDFKNGLCIQLEDVYRIKKVMRIITDPSFESLNDKYESAIDSYIHGYFRDTDLDSKIVECIRPENLVNTVKKYLREDNMVITII